MTRGLRGPVSPVTTRRATASRGARSPESRPVTTRQGVPRGNLGSRDMLCVAARAVDLELLCPSQHRSLALGDRLIDELAQQLIRAQRRLVFGGNVAQPGIPVVAQANAHHAAVRRLSSAALIVALRYSAAIAVQRVLQMTARGGGASMRRRSARVRTKKPSLGSATPASAVSTRSPGGLGGSLVGRRSRHRLCRLSIPPRGRLTRRLGPARPSRGRRPSGGMPAAQPCSRMLRPRMRKHRTSLPGSRGRT